MITNQEAILEALADTVDMLEREETTENIVVILDRDYSMPPGDGRKLVMFARALRTRIRQGGKS